MNHAEKSGRCCMEVSWRLGILLLNSDDNINKKDYSIKITDAELFAACEGRTARKGARGEQQGKLKRADPKKIHEATDNEVDLETLTAPKKKSKHKVSKKSRKSSSSKKQKKSKNKKHM